MQHRKREVMRDIEKSLFVEECSLVKLIEKTIKDLPEKSLLKQITEEYRSNGKDAKVYFVNRELIRRLIELISDRSYKEIEADIKNIFGNYSFIADYILDELKWILKDLKNIIGKVNRERLNSIVYILFPFANVLPHENLIILYTTNDSDKLTPILLHEYVHILRLDLYVWNSLVNSGFVKKLDKRIRKEIVELVAELATIYLLENAGLGELVEKRRSMIEETFQKYQKLKEEVAKYVVTQREIKMMAYIKAYELIRNNKIKIIRTVERGIRKYLEELKYSKHIRK
jgi:hypothetical protein